MADAVPSRTVQVETTGSPNVITRVTCKSCGGKYTKEEGACPCGESSTSKKKSSTSKKSK